MVADHHGYHFSDGAAAPHYAHALQRLKHVDRHFNRRFTSQVDGAWIAGETAGGNWKNPSWRTNKQWVLELTATTSISIILRQKPISGQVLQQSPLSAQLSGTRWAKVIIRF